jgi:drug/metabolite transporter (DMT)-like permease
MNRFVGIILIIISAAAFGTLGILGQFAYAEEMDTLSIMALRFTLAALVLLALLVLRHEALPRGGDLVRLSGRKPSFP